VSSLGLAALAVLAVLLWWSPPPRPWTPTPVPGTATAAPAAARSALPVAALVPEALELLALSLQGGGSVGAGARCVAQVLPGAASTELGGVAEALTRGQDPDRAWAAAGPRWHPARRALDLAAQAGVAPSEALRRCASDLRQDAVAGVEAGTARLGVRLVLPLGLAFLPAFVLTTVLPLVLALTRGLAW
jgi:hypothetical protein